MRKWTKVICSAFCFLNMALPGSVLALNLDDQYESLDDRSETFSQEDKEHLLTFMAEDSSLQSVSMLAEAPIDALHLYLADTSGRIIKDAQVITTIIDAQGRHVASRATPYKCGYFVAIDQLPAGSYRVETEIVTLAQLWTDEFALTKA